MTRNSLFIVFILVGLAFGSFEFPGSAYTRECNNHGIVYSDSDYSICECFDCYHGQFCENYNDNCVVNVAGGNPSVAQQYWEHVLNPAAISSSQAYYRTPYELKSGLIPPEPMEAVGVDKYLRESIINIHKFANNAETEGYYIVYGQGGTQLINAAAYALAYIAEKQLPVFAQVPYYGQYKAWAEFNSLNNYWNSSLNQIEHENEIIEFVTTPNNPDGSMRTPYYSNSTNLVYDMVYYWPSWTTVTEKANHDIMLFSLSKLSGHAGSRFGWALVKDFEVAKAMRSLINLLNIHTSLDTAHRAITILDAMVAEDGAFFTAISDIMQHRYSQIIPLFSQQSRFSLESTTDPATWFYLWIKCNSGENCYNAFLDGGIAGEPGSLYGGTDDYVRIQLTERSVDYNVLFTRLSKLLTNSQ